MSALTEEETQQLKSIIVRAKLIGKQAGDAMKSLRLGQWCGTTTLRYYISAWEDIIRITSERKPT